MVQVYIALGSNLNMPTEQLNSALEAISALPNTELKSVSGFYQSKPLGPQDQPDYVNAVAMIETTRPPLALLDELQRIEMNKVACVYVVGVNVHWIWIFCFTAIKSFKMNA